MCLQFGTLTQTLEVLSQTPLPEPAAKSASTGLDCSWKLLGKVLHHASSAAVEPKATYFKRQPDAAEQHQTSPLIVFPETRVTMSLQWTAVATFLYAEVFLVLLLCIPFISPKRWNKIFKSRIVQAIALYGNTSFMVAMAILVFLLIDAFREVRKYSVTEKVDLTNNPTAIEHIHMKLFRAQRNEYIAGFALLLCLLLRRLATLLSQQATLMASNEAFKKQAEGASNAAKKYMEENELLQEKLRDAGIEVPEAGRKGPGVQEENKALKEDVKSLKEELEGTKKALQKSDSDVRAMKKQAENLTVEYDRLLDEHSKLLATSDKKSD
ncbi:LOW QUALITY PROTEIN: B-cell receptor-associated protein 31 [Neosynchiropus ocellatus]